MFQSTVNVFNALGIPGEYSFDGPIRAKEWNLSSSGVPNVIGYAFTEVTASNPNPAAGAMDGGVAQVGGTGVFAGIFINPKEQSSNGTVVGGPLGPTLVVPDNTLGTLCDMGEVFVVLPGPANPGDLVTYDPATGALNSIPPTVKFTGAIVATAGGDVLTVTAVSVGTLAVGQLITGTGVYGGTYIAKLGSGTGDTGTYLLTTIDLQTVASEAMTAPNLPAPAFAASAGYITTSAGVDTLHIVTLTSGELNVGDAIFGTGIPANTVITAYSGGTGGTGTYTLNTSGLTVASSGAPIAITGPTNITIPRCVVGIYGGGTSGGVASIKLTQ